MTPRLGEALPAPGDTFADKYTIVRVVGEGGVGVVFEAVHQRLKQRVAIKVLRSEARRSAEWLARFEREARAAAEIRGPNVAKVFDVDSLPDGTPFMVMELLTGHDLAIELGQRKPFPVSEAVGYMLEACAAMAEAHALGIIHRDLTPRNLFLAEEGGRRCIKVVDFGISKVVSDRRNVTAIGAAFGTPNYVSPEQIRSTSQVDARADIWSLGVILFEMLAGSLPFEAQSAAAVVAAVVTDPPRPLGDLRPDLPKKLVAAVMRTLTKDPAARYARVEDFAAAIAPFGPLTASSSILPATRMDAPVPSSLRPSAGAAPSHGDAGRALWIAGTVISAAVFAIVLFAQLRSAPAPSPAASDTTAPLVNDGGSAPIPPAAPAAPSAEPSTTLVAASASAVEPPSATAIPRPSSLPATRRPSAPPARQDVRANPLHL